MNRRHCLVGMDQIDHQKRQRDVQEAFLEKNLTQAVTQEAPNISDVRKTVSQLKQIASDQCCGDIPLQLCGCQTLWTSDELSSSFAIQLNSK